jgi:hypothetical protein
MVEQSLHPIWACRAGLLGQLPAVFAFNTGKQATQERSCLTADLHPVERGAIRSHSASSSATHSSTCATSACTSSLLRPAAAETTSYPRKVRLQDYQGES